MNRHPFRWGSLVFGVLFAAATAAWVVSEYELLDAGTAGLLAAGTLIVLGLIGIAATVQLSRRPRHQASGTLDDTTPETTDHDIDPDPDTDTDDVHDEEGEHGEEASTQRR